MDADAFPRAVSRPGADRLLPDHRRRRHAHRAPRQRTRAALAIAALLAVMAAGIALALAPGQAHASVRSTSYSALKWAEAHEAGHPYCWGGTGPCYDCSGAVYEAYLHEGVNIGRDTFDMLASARLREIPLSQARQGDLLFYGTGHVEFATLRGSFGALNSGTLVGWHRPGASWHPTMAFRLR